MSFLDQAKKDEKKAVVRVLEIDSDGQFDKEELGFGVKMKKDEKTDCFFIITSSSVLRSLDGNKIVVDRYCSQYPNHIDNEDHRSEVYKVEISSKDEDVSFVFCRGGRTEEFLDVYEEFPKECHRSLFAYAFHDQEMIQLVFENKSSNDDYKLKKVSKKGFHVRRAKGAPIIVFDPISEEPKVVGIVGVKKNGDLYPVFLTEKTFAFRADHPKEQEDASSFASEKKDDGSLKSCTDEAKGLYVDASLGCDVTDRAIHPADLQGQGEAPLIVTGLTGNQKGVQASGPLSAPIPNSHSATAYSQLDHSALEKQCQEFLLNGLAPTYASAQHTFIDFCRQLSKVPVLPADEKTLCLFVTFLAQSLQHRSIKVYLSAVRALHIEQGFPDPMVNCPLLQQLFRGIKRSQGSLSSQRLPITDSLMFTIFKALNMDSFDHAMFWAACTLAYFGFLRLAEFTVSSMASFNPTIHLQVSDLAFNNLDQPSCLRVWIKTSKTDPFRIGCHVHIGCGVPPLCAVSAMSAYLHKRGSASGPLFLLKNGQPLSRELLTSWLRNIFSGAGVTGNFSSHSFRIGAATVAAHNGIPDHIIQTLGRWTRNAYQGYIRTPEEALAPKSRYLS